MATATCKISVLNPPQYSIGSSTVDYYFNLTFSAATDTYATGGITLDLTQATNLASTSTLPLAVYIYSIATQPITGSNPSYYSYVQGTAQNNGKLQIFVANAQKANAEAMNAGANQFGDTIRLIATFARR